MFRTTSILALAATLLSTSLASASEQQAVIDELRLEHQLALIHGADLSPELEPCINGAVSSSGTFENDRLEQAVEAVSRLENLDLLEASKYYRLVLIDNQVVIR
ncbi:hypothetical protein [Halochromatium sp.]